MDLTYLPRFFDKVIIFHEPFLNHPFVTQELGPGKHQEVKSSLAGWTSDSKPNSTQRQLFTAHYQLKRNWKYTAFCHTAITSQEHWEEILLGRKRNPIGNKVSTTVSCNTTETEPGMENCQTVIRQGLFAVSSCLVLHWMQQKSENAAENIMFWDMLHWSRWETSQHSWKSSHFHL